MKSSLSSSEKINWSSPIEKLFRSKKTKTCEKLESIDIRKIEDLLWLLPLKIQKLPHLNSFNKLCEGELFTGQGVVVSFQARPNFRVRGKRGIPLHNITAVVKDSFSNKTLNIKWFNTYPSLKEKISKAKALYFTGEVQVYQEQWQIISPDYHVIEEKDFVEQVDQKDQTKELRIQYPTTAGVSSSQINKVFDKIPTRMWEDIPENLPQEILNKRHLMTRKEAFQISHGRLIEGDWGKEKLSKAYDRLIYEEIFIEQVKIKTRRSFENKKKAPQVSLPLEQWKSFQEIFPYELTQDQVDAINDIQKDFLNSRPMMRLVQGDVGCGKTSVAIVAALAVIEKGLQVAFMCPTESLAQQHFKTAQDLFANSQLKAPPKMGLLIGSQKTKDKQLIQKQIARGEIQLAFGTHSLIQKNVHFKNLALAIIDEQHKFGVNQRIELIQKGKGVHCLIMTATPIPRSLSLTQYGDLDITTIKNLPSGRKGIKTRIVEPSNFENFLSFTKTRLSMGEQAYVVVPAIAESPTQDVLNLEQTEKNFKRYFPDFSIEGLHGQMNPDEKNQVFERFISAKTQLIVATSVIEVGINVINASIMAILSPERFGLSSLHQLRGRVGRGKGAGFCFLVLDKAIAKESMERLEVIENNIDGFKIAEEDLKIRGEGNLFGKEQSGSVRHRKVSDLIKHQHILENAREDLLNFFDTQDIQKLTESFAQNERIFSTV